MISKEPGPKRERLIHIQSKNLRGLEGAFIGQALHLIQGKLCGGVGWNPKRAKLMVRCVLILYDQGIPNYKLHIFRNPGWLFTARHFVRRPFGDDQSDCFGRAGGLA